MAFRKHDDRRADAMNLYVTSDDVLTDVEIGEQLGVHPNTIGNWRRKDNWQQLRNDKKITPKELSERIKRALVSCIEDIENTQKESGITNQEYIKRLDYYSRILVRIDGWYDLKGNMLEWSRHFIEYLRQRDEKNLLKELNRVLPEFYSFVETRSK